MKGISTKAVHVGQDPDPSFGDVIPPIHLSSTFAQSAPGEHQGFDYSRAGNPTRARYEACLAALENGEHGFAFASGLAASDAVIRTLQPGDHVLCSDDVYGGTFRLFERILKNQTFPTGHLNIVRDLLVGLKTKYKEVDKRKEPKGYLDMNWNAIPEIANILRQKYAELTRRITFPMPEDPANDRLAAEAIAQLKS